jgi:nucleotide-sensitive chloride channel 1A
VPLAEHQSRTPSSFYEGPPVLHYHSERCKIVILERDLVATPALRALRSESAVASSEQDDDKEVAIEGIETWVTSE